MKTLKNKTIWIVGASSGIGAALAENLHERGARLVLSARSRDKLEALNIELDGIHEIEPLDICDFDAVQKAVDRIGGIDIAIFLAASYTPGLIEKAEIEAVHQMIDVNLKGALNFIHCVYPRMIKAGSGQIVLCGSVAGYCGLPNSQPYSATKAAMINLAQSLRTEAKPHGIDVRLISPGFVKTPMTSKNDFDMPMIIEPEQAAREIAEGLLSRRFEIHFPARFTWIVKILSLLPYPVYFRIADGILIKKTGANS